MGYRRGYKAEYRAKKELQETYGRENVIKVAIGGAEDFLVVGCGELIRIIEVKEIHNRKIYYPSLLEKQQFERIICFSKIHYVPCELWIYKFFGTGKPVIKETKNLYEVK
jgi:Holliday junction resolvase